MAGTAYIIKTADGVSQINYSDGSVQTGTEEQLRETLASNLPDYDIKVVSRDYSSADNISKHQAKYEDIGDYASRQMERFGSSSSTQSQTSQAESDTFVDSGGYNISESDKRFYDKQGNLPSYIQDDLDRVTGEGGSGIPSDPDDYTISGGKGNWTITWSDGTTAQTTVRNPASAANDARLLANAFKARQAGTGGGESAKSAIDRYIASYEHFIATGQDDGGGFINKQTGLPIGANNQAEAFLMRSGNYVMSNDTLLGILDNVSNNMKDSLVQQMGVETWDQARQATAQNLMSNVLGSVSDNRDYGKLLAVSAYSSDAFVNAFSVANTQSYTVGEPTWNPETGEFQGYNRGQVSFGMVNGQPMMTGVAGNSGLSKQILDGLWVSPDDIQGVVEGDVYDNYQSYYDKFRKSYEFLNDYDFLNLKGLDNKIIQKPADTSGLSVQPNTSSYVDYSGSAVQPNMTQTFQTSASAPVTYDPQQVTQTYQTAQPQLAGPATGTYPQAAVSGTFNLPTQTAGLSAVPQTITTKTDYTGTNMANLTQPSQGVGGVEQVAYQNPNTQQVIRMTEINGSPIGVVPPGFQKVTSAAKGAYINGYNEGGLVEAEKTMASKFLGFKGGDLEKFLEANPAAAAKMGKYRTALRNKMTQKGTVFAQGGTFVDAAGQLSNVSGMGDQYQQQLAAMQRGAIQQTMQPVQSNVQMMVPDAADFVSGQAGQAYPLAPFAQAATVPSTAQAGMPMTAPASTMTTGAAAPAVQAQTDALQAATGVVSQPAQIEAAQQVGTSISGIDAAQGNAILMDNPVQREIQEGEIISGAANAEKAAAFTEQVQAATATPSNKATVAGQLETLMADFEGGETPAWAAGSMRTAMQTLAARGLGASSLAGQAVVQAAMEAALPIAQMDAQTMAQFEAQNLSNRQQRAMLAAQQRATFLGQEFDQAFQARVANASRIADIANLNFNAEQQIALENSRAANTMNLTNLTNRQAMVMSEAAALSQLDMANLNNRQQAAVQNAQSFLQMDLTNLSNEQQTAMFKSQQNIQALLTDQAAENAAAQFNATSENQTNQFFASLTSQVSQFNATQQNAMDQFNVNSVNALREFNSELQQQRDLFNAQNGLVVAQANAQWRQNIATMNTAALNESNATFARTINGLTQVNMEQIWQRERDIMSFAFQTANNNADRATSIAVEQLRTEATKEAAEGTKSAGFAKAAGTIIGAIITG